MKSTLDLLYELTDAQLYTLGHRRGTLHVTCLPEDESGILTMALQHGFIAKRGAIIYVNGTPYVRSAGGWCEVIGQGTDYIDVKLF